MADFEKYFVFTLAGMLQVLARLADLTTVWLLSTWGQKQLQQDD